jgi:spermidine/putrescine transport system ATP-binding protein
MSAGELQQLGEAREIYEAPRNVFVADFIGDTNLMEVTVDAIDAGRARCHLGGGHRLTCDAVDGIGVGGQAHVSLRPERLFLSAEPTDVESLPGTVRETIYIGTDIATIVDLQDGPQFTVRSSNSTRGNARVFDPGQKVAVNMETGAARLLLD